MRVVLDTNVVVSGLLFGGRPAMLLGVLAEPHFEVWSSGPALEELVRVISAPKFRQAVARIGPSAAELAGLFAKGVRIVADADLPALQFPADSDDAYHLATAQASSADWLVTGDHHLLEARLEFRCEVLTVAEALRRADELLRRSQPP